MTGYLYQCELALLELARRSWDEATIEVHMELLDDIEFLNPQDNTPLELLQSKHREAAGPLSETGKDFWRSLASWIDALKNLSDPSGTSMPLLRLVSTQIAPANTFLQQLRPGADRDVSNALARMEEVAQDEDGPDGTAKDRALFMKLTPAQRHQLVSAITINDGAPVMSDLDSSLAKELGITPSEHAQAGQRIEPPPIPERFTGSGRQRVKELFELDPELAGREDDLLRSARSAARTLSSTAGNRRRASCLRVT